MVTLNGTIRSQKRVSNCSHFSIVLSRKIEGLRDGTEGGMLPVKKRVRAHTTIISHITGISFDVISNIHVCMHVFVAHMYLEHVEVRRGY